MIDNIRTAVLLLLFSVLCIYGGFLVSSAFDYRPAKKERKQVVEEKPLPTYPLRFGEGCPCGRTEQHMHLILEHDTEGTGRKGVR